MVLNMDAVMVGFLIFQDSEYARFLCMQALHKVLNMAEYCPMARPDQHFTGF